MNRSLRISLLLVLALPMGSCGGGGKPDRGGGVGDGTFVGTYFLAQFSALRSFLTPAAENTSGTWGRVVADGMGMATATVGENENGVVSAPSPQAPVPYSVAADGSLVLPSTIGGIAADGKAGVLMTNVPGREPEMGCVLRTDGVYSNLSFVGSYHLGQIAALLGSRASFWSTTALGPVVADGMGTLTYPTLALNSGIGVATVAGGSIPYAITVDGVLTTQGSTGPVQGALLPDGSFALAGGGTSASDPATMLVLIKYSSAATAALFKGSYWIVGISNNLGSNGDWTSLVGSVTADGAGSLTLTSGTQNEEGGIAMVNGPDTYAVAPNGALTSGIRVGAISEDGRYAFLCGDTAGANSALLVFIRK